MPQPLYINPNTPKPAGMIIPPNIDLKQLPVINNGDGSYSTVYGTSFEDEKPGSPTLGKEILVRGILNGKKTDDTNALRQEYYKTGKHLGIFNSGEEATAYSTQLHNDWEAGKIPGVQMGQPKVSGQPTMVYDPTKDETHYWIQGKRYTAPGDLAKNGNIGQGQGPVKKTDGSIDIPGTIRDVGMGIIPALASALMPEATVAKPLIPLLGKAAASITGGTAFDQLMSAIQGKDKPLLDSGMSAAGYTGVGLAPELIPGLGNLGVELKGLTKGSSTVRNRSNSGTARTSSSTSGTSGPEMVPGPPIWEPRLSSSGKPMVGGKFVPGPDVPTGNQLNTSNTQGTTSSSGQGTDVTNSIREVMGPGILGHITEALRMFKPYLKTGPGGAPILDPYSSALLGFSLNGATGNLGPESKE